MIAPSNPFVSIAPVLGVPGIRDALAARRDDTVCISPLIGGAAVKGPAADLARTLGHEVSAVAVARLLVDVAGHMVLDTVDAELADAVRETGVTPTVTDTMMRTPEIAAALATTTVNAVA